MTRTLLLAALLGALLDPSTVAAPIPKPRERKGHATPEACYKAWVAAYARKDYKAKMACLTADAQAIRAGWVLYMAAFEIKVGRDKSGELQKLVAKHGVTREWLEKALTDVQNMRSGMEDHDRITKALSKNLKDKPGFAAEVLTFLTKARTKPISELGAKITKVTINGKKAELTVEMEAGGNHVVQSVRCERDKGGWRMHLPRGKSAKAVSRR